MSSNVNTSSPEQPASAAHPALEEMSLIDLLIVLSRHKLLVLGLPVIAAILAVIVALLLPNVYVAVTRILPPQQPQSGASMLLGQLGALSGVAGQSLGLKNPNDLYVGMLQSRSIAERLRERFNLNELYDAEFDDDAIKRLDNNTEVTAGKDGIITLRVSDKDPARAAAIANAYIEELLGLQRRLALTEAGQRRIFFERQMEAAKSALAEAEVALRKTQESTGLIKLDDQGRAIIEAVAQIRAAVAAKEVQIGVMQRFAAPENPELLSAKEELVGLSAQLARLERAESRDGTGASVLVPFGKVPKTGLEYIRRFRDVKYFETKFELLAKQYEIAKLDEARESGIVQVLDVARAPDRKASPKRALIVILTTILASAAGVALAFAAEALERGRRDVVRAARLAALRDLWIFRR